jgi:hypothetical protein
LRHLGGPGRIGKSNPSNGGLAKDVPQAHGIAFANFRPQLGQFDDVRRVSRDGRRRRSRASVGPERKYDPKRLGRASDGVAMAADERLLRAGGARRLYPRPPRLWNRERRDQRRGDSGRRARRPMDAVLPAAPFPQSRRRGRSQDPPGRADVGPFRHPVARHDPHAAARPPSLHHRLDQPAQRQARGRRIHARGLYQPPDRLRPLHRRGLPRRRRLPADRFGARGDRGHGSRARRGPAGESHVDGRSDRRPHLPDEGQRARPGETDRMVPRQYDRNRAGQVRRAAGAASIPAFFSSAPS